jgi:hypothetical protein
VDALIAALLAALGTLLGLAVALRVVGRRRLGAPRCAACGADVHARVWTGDATAPPTCACGATLDRAGAVRTMREPAPRWVRRACTILAIFAGLLLGADVALRASGVRWIRLVPTAWLPAMGSTLGGFRNDAASAEALVELDRRVRAKEVSPGQALRLLEVDLDRAFWRVRTADTYGLTVDLGRIAYEDREGMRAHLERTLTVNARLAPSTGTIDCLLEQSRGPGFGIKVTRIERVLIDGVACEWTLLEDLSPIMISMVGPRAFNGRARLRVTPPEGGGSELRIECTIAIAGHVDTLIDVEDPIINDPAVAASEWRINAIPVARTIILPLGGRAPSGGTR